MVQSSLVKKALERKPAYVRPGEKEYLLDQQWMAKLIGLIAVFLPVVLFATKFAGVCFYGSISHYYYSTLPGAVFVAALSIVGAFLMAYRDQNRFWTSFAFLAGVAAVMVAIFPTSGDGCDIVNEVYQGRPIADLIQTPLTVVPVFNEPATPGFLQDTMSPVIHYGSAAFLFLFLTAYCLLVLVEIEEDEDYDSHGNLKAAKALRNKFYKGCAKVMVFVVAVMLVRLGFGQEWKWWNSNNLTFYCEAAALIAFGTAWLTKGRFWFKSLLDDRDVRIRQIH